MTTIDNRIWTVITVIVCAALLAGAWFLGASPMLDEAAAADDTRETVETTNAAAQGQIAVLQAAEERRPELEAELAEMKNAIPARLNGSAFIATLNQLAVESGAVIQSLDLSEPVPYEPEEAEDPGAPAPVTQGSITAENFVVVPVDMSVSGSNDAVIDFLGRLQTADRFTLVTSVTNTVGEGGVFEMSIGGSVFVLADAPVEATTEEAPAE